MKSNLLIIVVPFKFNEHDYERFEIGYFKNVGFISIYRKYSFRRHLFQKIALGCDFAFHAKPNSIHFNI